MAELARRLNKSPQAFHQKVKRGGFSLEELNDIALVTGCEFNCAIVFPNGEKIIVE